MCSSVGSCMNFCLLCWCHLRNNSPCYRQQNGVEENVMLTWYKLTLKVTASRLALVFELKKSHPQVCLWHNVLSNVSFRRKILLFPQCLGAFCKTTQTILITIAVTIEKMTTGNDNNNTDDKNDRNEKDYGMINRNVYFIV